MAQDDFKYTCTYCAKKHPDVKPLPPDLNENPRFKYCPKCYPEVLQEVRNLPWNRNKY